MKSTAILGIVAGALLASQVSAAMIDITSDSIPAGQTKTWSASNKYILHGKVCVEAGAELIIPAGTMVLGDLGTGANVSMLVICRDGKLFAQGTSANPVVFTSVADTMGVPLPISNLTRGLWGGLVILGRAHLNEPGGVGVFPDITIPATDTAKYRFGDSTNVNDHDTSGILQYVSIRFAGASDVATVKGFSLEAVGDGTLVDHVENFECGDDGVNLLGGSVNIKYLASAFNAGDAVYYDEGYRGKMQFIFAIQDTISGGSSNGCMSKIETNATKIANSNAYSAPFTFGQIYNATYVGTGISNKDTWKYKYGIYYKKGGAGKFINSILTQCYNYGVYIEDLGTADTLQGTNCRARFNEDSLVITNNIFYGFGKGNSIDSITKGIPWLASYIDSTPNQNDLTDPQMGGFGWGRDGLLDPRPSATGVAMQNVATVPNDGFFTQTAYRGAFDPSMGLWASGWTQLATTGFFKSTAVGVVVRQAEKVFSAIRITGKGNVRTLSWNQLNAGMTTIRLFSASGKLVRLFENTNQGAGAHTVSISLKDFASGVYILQAKCADQLRSSIIEKQ
jgi:hypothetical protein